MIPKTGKILLLQSPITLKEEDVPTYGFFPPLGLAYLAGVLLRDNFEVEIIDLLIEGAKYLAPVGGGKIRWGLPDKEIERIVQSKAPGIVGITNNFTSFSTDCIRLARIVRKCLPDTLIVIGGAHASMEPKSLLSNGVVDVVVIGEGEFIFRDLVEAVFKKRLEEARKIAGTVWAAGKEIIDNGWHEPTSDLDAIPFPAYHLLPMERYIWQKRANFAAVMRWPVGHMITTRGCPYNCIFCSTSKHFKKFRRRSPKNVLAEMKTLIKDYGIREFTFHDDNFMADPEGVRSLCRMIVQNGLDIRWQVSQGINSNLLDEELLELMRNSGMYRVGFPIESGCQETLRFIRKPIQLEKTKKLIEKCNCLGIYCFGGFMIGLPEETREQIKETIDFIMNSGLDYVKISIAQPLAGSDLYPIYKSLHLLSQIKDASTYFYTAYDTIYFKAEELDLISADIFHSFSRQRIKNLFKPGGIKRFIFPKIYSFESFIYFLRMGWLALKGFRG